MRDWTLLSLHLLGHRTLVRLALLVSACVSGCTIHDAIAPVTPTPFLVHANELEKLDKLPFEKAWIAPEAAAWRYDSLVVDAVETDRVDPGDWIYSAGTFIPTRESYLDRVQELAEYIQEETSERFEEYRDKPRPLEVSQTVAVELVPPPPLASGTPRAFAPIEPLTPPSRELRLRLSISEANFGDPVLYGGLLAVPIPAIANLSTAVKAPSLTVEAKLVDGPTGRVIMEILDRRFPQIKIVDINRLTDLRAVKELADSFAEDLVEAFYLQPGERVGRRWAFSLLPW